jgi:integrase
MTEKPKTRKTEHARLLSDVFLRSLAKKPHFNNSRPIWDDGVDGVKNLCVIVKSTPRFYLYRRFPGSSNPTAGLIGEYPDTSLEAARDTAREWKRKIKVGKDPRTARKRDQQPAAPTAPPLTVKQAFETFDQRHLSSLRRYRDTKVKMERELKPWFALPLAHFETEEGRRRIGAAYREIHYAGKERAAQLFLANCRTFLEFCINDDMMTGTNQARNVKKLGKAVARDRVLDLDELRAIWLASDGLHAFGRAVRLMILTGCRRSEVAEMVWDEINFERKMWVIPAARSKNGKPHAVPLTDLMLEAIGNTVIGDYVFSTGARGDAPIGGWHGFKAQLTARIDGEPLPQWHLHDLRRSFATHVSRELKAPDVVLSALLNHAPVGVTRRVYDRNDFLIERTKMLEAWSKFIVKLLEARGAENVVSISAA